MAPIFVFREWILKSNAVLIYAKYPFTRPKERTTIGSHNSPLHVSARLCNSHRDALWISFYKLMSQATCKAQIVPN